MHRSQIADIEIEKPVFIVGLPRSGTTLIHNLMSLHPNLHTPLYWELRNPVTPRGMTNAELIQGCRDQIDELYKRSPSFRAIHYLQADRPDECTWLLANEMASFVYGSEFDVPEYVNWLQITDMADAFTSHRQQIQHIIWRRPGPTIVLKDPYHALSLCAINKNYQDARYIYLHRDPQAVLASLCSLCESIRAMSYKVVNPEALAMRWLPLISQLVLREREFRSQMPLPGRTVDVSYESLQAAPVKEMQTILTRLNIEFDRKFRDRILQYLARHPRHEFGVHRYSLNRFCEDESVVLDLLKSLSDMG